MGHSWCEKQMWEPPNNEYLEPPNMGLWCLWIGQISTTNNHYWGRFSRHPKVKISKFAPDLEDINPKLWLRSPQTSGCFFCLKSFSRVEFEIPPFGFLDCSFNLLFLAYHGIPVLVLERTTSLDVEVQCATCRYQTDEIKTILLDGWQSNRRHEKNSTGVIWGRWTTSAWRCKRKRRHVKVCSYPVVGGANDIGIQL